jgi:coenzyme F420 biosynthesis associated uncharacterized protein
VGSPVDWDRAEAVAQRVARRRPSCADGQDQAAGSIDLGELEDRIAAVTGLRAPQPLAAVQWLDRDGWIRANIASFRHLLQPLFDRLPASSARLESVTRRVAATEIGVLLGWMSTRVLGQYDLLLADTDAAGSDRRGSDGAVYLVQPNLDALDRRFGFDRHQFRTWVLLHELTHRAQFTGVPWLRDHFHGLVDELIAAVDPSPNAMFGALRSAITDRADARRRIRDGGLAGLVATPRQRAVLERIGGLMSLLEGHGDLTMTRAAGGLVPDAERFAAALAERRRNASPIARLIQQLLGIEAKLDQYRAGARFITMVEDERGHRGIDVCWDRPANLPGMAEIREPELWMARVALVG